MAGIEAGVRSEEDLNIDGLSLDQLRIILRVADEGSFSAAARSVRRAQSAVSYSVAQAEAHLGVILFDRAGRAPTLTPTGRILLHDIRNIVSRVDGLRSHARTVASGLEAEITLAADAVVNPELISAALGELHRTFPSVSIRIHTDALGMVVERVLQNEGALGVIATIQDLPDGLIRYALPDIELRAVASCSHPLAKLKGPDRESALRHHLQIVLSDRSSRTERHDYGVCSGTTWRVYDLAQKYCLIKAGLGWGALPTWMIGADLADNTLVPIAGGSLPDPDHLTVQAFHSRGIHPGPALAYLIDAFCNPCQKAGLQVDA